MPLSTLSPAEFHHRQQADPNLRLIDVRSPAEFSSVHAAGAVNLPLERVSIAEARSRSAQGPLYVICKSGARGRKACERLAADGAADVVNIDGGTDAWVAAGLPVVRGKARLPIDRQVQMIAGSLVLAGTLLGYFVHVAFLAVPAFIGTGLTFAGLSGWCGMGLLLARAPWNQR